MRRRGFFGLPFGLGACSVLPERAYQQTHDWPLLVPLPPTRAASARAPVLLVRPVRAAAGLEPRGLQTLLPNGSLRTDVYDEWAAPPADAVTDQLRLWLAGCGLFAAVIEPGSRLNAAYVLEAELTALWVVQSAAQARAELTFVVIDQRGGGNLIGQGVISGVAPAADDTPAVRARAELVALSAAFADLTTQLGSKRLNG